MRRTAVALCLAAGSLVAARTPAAEPLRVGLLPFDFAVEEGSSATAAKALAKLLRAQMIKTPGLQPLVLEPPEGRQPPLSPKAIVEVAGQADVQLVITGTVLEATTTHSSNRASSYGLPTGGYGAVGGSLSRVKAKVVMQVELVDPATGQVFDTFEVEGSNTDVGVGADLSTTLGSFDVGDSGWDKSPMGKALREVAEKASKEIAKRGAKRAGAR